VYFGDGYITGVYSGFSWLWILRNRWKNLRDRFSFSKHLKSLLKIIIFWIASRLLVVTYLQHTV